MTMHCSFCYQCHPVNWFRGTSSPNEQFATRALFCVLSCMMMLQFALFFCFLTVGDRVLPHPLSLAANEWKDDMKLWPSLQENHITYYLLKTKACDLEDVQAIKSLDSYNYVISGKVGQLLVCQADKGTCFIKGKVSPSQADSDRPYETGLHRKWLPYLDRVVLLQGRIDDRVQPRR